MSFVLASGQARRFDLAILLVAILACPSVLAQTRPDAGQILQESRPQIAPPPVTIAPIHAPVQPRPALPKVGDDVRVAVTQFDFIGNSVLSTAALRAAVARWAGRSLSFGDLVEAVEAIEARYKEAGYFLAQAYLPPQKIKDGAIEIAISEGLLGAVRLEGESRVSPDVLYGYLDRLPQGKALTFPLLERQVLLINELAGGRATLDLQAGEKPGSTDVVLAQQSENLVTGRIDANNYGLPSTGEKRLGITANANSPFNLGERVSFNALTSDSGGLASYNLRGELPVGGDGWRLTAAISRAEYTLGGDFSSLEASGTADSWRLGAAYPLIRSRVSSLKILIEADESKLRDSFQSTNTVLDKRSQGLTATVTGDWLDEWLGGGSSRIDLALRSGQLTLGASAAAVDAPPTGPGSAGRFSKATLAVQRQQTATRELSLQLQLSGQLSDKNLDSSEKLSLGGPGTIPGYASGEVVADSGGYAKLGLRWQFMPEFALTSFIDEARVRLAHEPLPTVSKNNKRLSDFGVSADWQISRDFLASMILAWAGKEAPADNARSRFWLNLGYAW